MPDHSEQRRDAVPNQGDASRIGWDLSERIYTRHARFVWPTSIASSLAQRFTPFTGERLSLATIVQRRWSVSNSSKSRRPDLHWLQALAPRRPRYDFSGKLQTAGRTIASSFGRADTSSSGSELALRTAPEVALSRAYEIAPSANTSQESGTALVLRVAKEEPSDTHSFDEVSRQIESVPISGTSNNLQNNSGVNVASPPHGRSSQASSLNRSVTVHSGPPIIRRSLAAPGAEIARVDSASKNISELSSDGETPVQTSIEAERLTGFSARENQVISESTHSRSQSVPIHSAVGRSVARETPKLEEIHAGDDRNGLRIQNAVTSQSELKSEGYSSLTLAADAQSGTQRASLPNVVQKMPDLIVYRDHATDRDPSIMRQATAETSKSHELSTQPALAQGPIAASSPATKNQRLANSSGHAVRDSAAPLQPTNKSFPRDAQDTSPVQLAAEDSRRDRTVFPESHSEAPIVHLKHESADRPPTGPSAQSVSESHGSALSSPILHAKHDSLTRPSSPCSSAEGVVLEDRTAGSFAPVSHLKRGSISSDISSTNSFERVPMNVGEETSQNLSAIARSQEGDSPAVFADRPNILSGPRIHAFQHPSVASVSRSHAEASKPFSRSEPTFRSTRAIFRFAGPGIGSRPNGGSGMSKNTSVPLVVQESVVEKSSRVEPFVLSRHALPGDVFRNPDASNFEDKGWLAMSTSLGSTAMQSWGLTHRSPSTIAGFSSPHSAGSMHLASLPVARQTTADSAFSSVQLPSLSAATGEPNAPSFGPQSPDIAQLANRVYEVLVRRLVSERQRRGR